MGSNLTKTEYLKAVKKSLPCSRIMKKAIIAELENEIDLFLEENPAASVADLTERFGTAEDIAGSFSARNDLDSLKKKVKRNKVLVLGACCIILILVIVLLVLWKVVLPAHGSSVTEYVSSSSVEYKHQ